MEEDFWYREVSSWITLLFILKYNNHVSANWRFQKYTAKNIWLECSRSLSVSNNPKLNLSIDCRYAQLQRQERVSFYFMVKVMNFRVHLTSPPSSYHYTLLTMGLLLNSSKLFSVRFFIFPSIFLLILINYG